MYNVDNCKIVAHPWETLESYLVSDEWLSFAPKVEVFERSIEESRVDQPRPFSVGELQRFAFRCTSVC